MNTFDYLLTPNGAYWRLFYRRRRCISLRINEEPLSKNSMSKKEKCSFQQEVLRQLKAQKKTGFHSTTELYVEINVCTKAQNPPHIHNIPKNYLDLLSKPITKYNKRKKIIFDDDKQVKGLSIKYRIKDDIKPYISFDIYPYKSLIEDIELAISFHNGEIKDEYYYYYQNSFDYDYQYTEEFFESLSDYYNHIKDKNKSSSRKYIEYINLYTVQRNFLRAQERNTFDLYGLLCSAGDYHQSISKQRHKNDPNLYSQFNEIYNSINTMTLQTLNQILFSPMNICLPSLPTQPGQKAAFKQLIKKSIIEYIKELEFLSPLLIPVFIKIFYKSPSSFNYNKDLDNIMKIIVPIFHDVFKPPISHISIDALGENKEKIITGVPLSIKNQIAGYEIIEVLRNPSDTSDGYLQIILCEQYSDSLLNKMFSKIHEDYSRFTW